MTKLLYSGSTAGLACPVDFHFASLWEIFDPTLLEYDVERGHTNIDSGQGPPGPAFFTVTQGWIRTGGGFNDGAITGLAVNCDAWSSASPDHLGTVVGLTGRWSDPASSISPWSMREVACDREFRVWCVEDR